MLGRAAAGADCLIPVGGRVHLWRLTPTLARADRAQHRRPQRTQHQAPGDQAQDGEGGTCHAPVMTNARVDALTKGHAMIASVLVRSALAAASSSIGEAMKNEIRTGLDIGKREISDLWRSAEATESEGTSGSGAFLVPLLAVGAVAVGAVVVAVPKVRNAVLDFNDGALRGALERAKASARAKWAQLRKAAAVEQGPRVATDEASDTHDASEVSHILAAEGAPDPNQVARRRAHDQRKEARRTAQVAARLAQMGTFGRH